MAEIEKEKDKFVAVVAPEAVALTIVDYSAHRRRAQRTRRGHDGSKSGKPFGGYFGSAWHTSTQMPEQQSPSIAHD